MPDDPSLPTSDAAAAYLRRFCATVLALLQEGSAEDSVLPRILPGLARTLGVGSRDLVAQLRGELAAWQAAADPLKKLSQSSFIQFGDEAAALLAKLERAHDRVAGVVAALEGLHATDLRPAEPVAPPAESSPEGEANAAVLDVRPDDEPPREEISDEDRAELLFREAEAHWHAKEYDAATDLYTQALQLNPQLRVAYLRRARIGILRGDTAAAIDDLTAALDRNAADPLAHWWRGDAHALAGRHDVAVADYSQALALAPTLFLARYNRAVSLRLGGQLDRALEEFDHLIQFKPTHGPLYLNRGLTYLAKAEAAGAIDDFRSALHYQPASKEAARRLQEAEALVRLAEGASAAPATDSGGAETGSADTDGASAPPPLRGREQAADAGDSTAGHPRPRKARPAAATAGWTRTLERTKVNSLAYQCPGCRKASAVRWDKLSLGKVLGCPHCRQRFTAKLDGRLVQVVRDPLGRWVDTEWIAERARRVRRRRLQAGAAALAVFLAAYALSWTPRLVEKLKPAPEAGLPTELVPRAEFFARAWLKGDLQAMKQMTDPVQDRQLFRWYRGNSPPGSAAAAADDGGVRVDVQVAPDNPAAAALRLRFDGLPDAKGQPVELRLSWLDRGGTWVFRPVPEFKLQAGG